MRSRCDLTRPFQQMNAKGRYLQLRQQQGWYVADLAYTAHNILAQYKLTAHYTEYVPKQTMDFARLCPQPAAIENNRCGKDGVSDGDGNPTASDKLMEDSPLTGWWRPGGRFHWCAVRGGQGRTWWCAIPTWPARAVRRDGPRQARIRYGWMDV